MFKMFRDKIKLQKIDLYSFIIILITFGIDRLSKTYVIKLIQSQEREIFVYDFLNLTLNWNTGIAFGILSYYAILLFVLLC